MNSQRDLAIQAGAPQDDAGAPVFDEPWQAQAFAITVALHAAGHFAWTEWAEYLGREIKKGDPATETPQASYYRCWLAALEKIVADKGLSSADELQARKASWLSAYEHSHFGQPVRLGEDHE